MPSSRLHPESSGQVAQWPSGQVPEEGSGQVAQWPSGPVHTNDAEGFSPGFIASNPPTLSGPKGLGVISTTPSLGHSATRPLGHFFSSRCGFSIVELLMVLILMSVLVVLTWPVMKSMTASNRIEGAVNAVSASSTVMRALNSQSRPDVEHSQAHNGTALIVLPRTNYYEIRWTTNTAVTKVGSDYKNVYNDLDSEREPARIPAGMGIVGIVKPGNDKLVNPPFAVRFNRFGQVIPGLKTEPAELVRYKNNVDLDCVVGVVVFDLTKAKAADLMILSSGQPTNNVKDSTVIEELVDKASGRLIFFSRYTGAAVMQGVAP